MREAQRLQQYVDALFERGETRNLALRVGYGNEIVIQLIKSADDPALDADTLFDMASVTKIMVTTSLALIAIDRGLLSPADKVSRFFPVPEDKRELSVRHLLIHTMGIGHKPLYKSEPSYDRVAEHVLDIPSDIDIGSQVRYSCPGFILLGKIVEQVFGDRLDRLFSNLVATPLGMSASCFLPETSRHMVNANKTEEEKGLVNDLNCRTLGGIAGNAGLFSTLDDTSRFARMMLDMGAPLISERTFTAAVRNYTDGMSENRGLGFLYVGESYAQTGGLFPVGSFGHCGHTGQSVFVHPESGLYAVILSDATASMVKKYGKENYEGVKQMRHDLHAAIKKDLAV